MVRSVLDMKARCTKTFNWYFLLRNIMATIETRTIAYFSDFLSTSIDIWHKYSVQSAPFQLSSASGGSSICNPYDFSPRRMVGYFRLPKEGYDTDKITKGRGATKASVLIPSSAMIQTAYSRLSGGQGFLCADYEGERWSSLPLTGITPQSASSDISERVSGSYLYTMDGTGEQFRLPVSTELFPTTTANWVKGLPGFTEDGFCSTAAKSIKPRHLLIKWRRPGNKTSGTVVRKVHIARPGDIVSAIQFASSLNPACVSYVGERVLNWQSD